MSPRLLIAVAAGLALAACSVEHTRVEQPAVAVAPATNTVVYTDPAPATTVYTTPAPVTTVYTTR